MFFSRRQFPFYKQHDSMDCGISSLRMISEYHGKIFSLQYLRDLMHLSRNGVSLASLEEAADKIGFRCIPIKIEIDNILKAPLPCIAHWKQNHFLVIHKIKNNKFYIADPALGRITLSKVEFEDSWISTSSKQGILLLLETTPIFYQNEEDENNSLKSKNVLLSYIKPHKKLVFQLFLGLLLGSIISLIFPILTASLIDIGIMNQNINFIYVILIAQLVLFLSKRSVEFIRGWILLHVSIRINISIISDYLAKLMKQPIIYFESRIIGDFLQRIDDHKRVENLLTAATLNTIFSLFNLFVFGVLLFIYHEIICLIYITLTLLSMIWIVIFLKKQKEYDNRRFIQRSENQNKLVQLISGIHDIKLCNSEKLKRMEWESLQAKLFHISIKRLTISQYQRTGLLFINEFKNIIITFISASAVINGEMTLGMMIAISYIMGQLNSPIEQLTAIFQNIQDGKLSLDRISEIQMEADEDNNLNQNIIFDDVPKSIIINSLSFSYEGQFSKSVIKDLSLEIPHSKITAIVGTSGSGKTTLLKLLLKFYNPTKGSIHIGDTNLKNYNSASWRSKCGVVMQDGYIFTDSIAKNIALGHEDIDKIKLKEAIYISNLEQFIDELPLSSSTKIGSEGHGLSQGQKQRILIARSVYKNPNYVFFDEATNSLDANTEESIINRLDKFFCGRTVVIVAHRLSTVKKADQIVVLNSGKIVEIGKHEELIATQGFYYKLIKNQLEFQI